MHHLQIFISLQRQWMCRLPTLAFAFAMVPLTITAPCTHMLLQWVELLPPTVGWCPTLVVCESRLACRCQLWLRPALVPRITWRPLWTAVQLWLRLFCSFWPEVFIYVRNTSGQFELHRMVL